MSGSSRPVVSWRSLFSIPPRTKATVTPVLWVVVVAILALAPELGLGVSPSRQLVLICFLCLLVSGLNLSYGFAGELSFASPAFYALGSYVTEHALGVDGPVREYYPIDARSTEDAASWRTEIGWPIFRTE